jgi:hypothetical protein
VGSNASNTAGSGEDLLEAWDGQAWIVQKVPNPGVSGANQLTDVACVSSFCVAVGNEYGSAGYLVPFSLVMGGA